MKQKITLLLITIMLFTNCTTDKKEKSLTEGGMKCGAGKCGSSMVDGSSILAQKKKNILDQMTKEDKRKECILNAKNTKLLYDCIRDEKTKRLKK